MSIMAAVRRYILFSLTLLTLLFCVSAAGADETEGLEEPEADYGTFISSIHVGQTHVWKPFVNYPDLPVRYSSDDTKIAVIADDGSITPVREGAATVTASTPRTDEYEACEAEMYFYVLAENDGLYLTDMAKHFYYEGAEYQPGELPAETERELCLTQPDLKLFIEDYLNPWEEKLEQTEAVLTAILNYGDQYFSKNSLFDGYTSSSEAGRTDWMQLLYRREGLCSYNASFFCYLMHLGGLPAMQVDSPVTEKRAHSWNLIEHNGYYYNLEEYDFLHAPKDRYVIPPLSEKTAAYFPGHIIQEHVVHFPVPGILENSWKIEDLGKDLSRQCPLLMYERGEDGEYRVRFDEIREGHIPEWLDGSPVSLDEISYKNMETDLQDGQYNEEAKPLFDRANALLWEEIAPLMKAEEQTEGDCERHPGGRI